MPTFCCCGEQHLSKDLFKKDKQKQDNKTIKDRTDVYTKISQLKIKKERLLIEPSIVLKLDEPPFDLASVLTI